MKINNLMKRLSATIVAIALTFSSLVLPLDAIAAASSSTAVTEDITATATIAEITAVRKLLPRSLISQISTTAVRANGQAEMSACHSL